MKTYLVAGINTWCSAVFEKTIRHYPGRWMFIGEKSALGLERVQDIAPQYIFFLHWSWIVPKPIVDGFRCVCFHMTDLPYGRGGTPLQNLIVRGHTETRVSALRMTEQVDAGPVYMKRKMRLHGSAAQIYARAARLSARMIRDIIEREPEPRPQVGNVVMFRRRTPEESCLPEAPSSLHGLYNHIRMLDADGYPRAFLDHGKYRLVFRNARLQGDGVSAQVDIIANEKGGQ